MMLIAVIFMMIVAIFIMTWLISDAIKAKRFKRKRKKEADKRRAETESRVVELHKNRKHGRI